MPRTLTDASPQYVVPIAAKTSGWVSRSPSASGISVADTSEP
jgi:hypothetical protein